MGQFIYSPINSIRLVQQTAEFDVRYNTLPFDFEESNRCYSQKRQFNDVEYLQCLSDWVPTLKIYSAQSGQQLTVINPTTPTNGIIDQTFILYQFQINWNAISQDCYIEITYTDDDNALQVHQSGVIQLATLWVNTLLFQYTHSTNKYSTIFSTGIVFNQRVESIRADYTPEFEDVLYNDQTHNTTLLNAIPFRTFTLYVPGKDSAGGLPKWMIDKVNWIFACDQVMIDGVYYRNNTGAKWDVVRADPDGTEFIGGKLQIIETNNLFLYSLKTGANQPQSYRIVSLADSRNNIAGNTTFTGLFNAESLLDTIVIINRGAAFTIRAGIVANGDEVLEDTEVPTGRNTYDVKYQFGAVSQLFFTIPTGSDIDIRLAWTQFDAPEITPGQETVVYRGRPDSVSEYRFTSTSQFNADWDITTGLGKGRYLGAALMDGQNGREDRGLRFPIGWKNNATFADLGITDQSGVIPFNSVFGNATTILTPENLPPLKVVLPGASSSGSGKIGFNQGGNAPTQLDVKGLADQSLISRGFSNLPPAFYTIYYTELPQ